MPPSLLGLFGRGAGETKEGRATKGREGGRGNSPRLRPKGGGEAGSGSLPQPAPGVAGLGGGEGAGSGAAGPGPAAGLFRVSARELGRERPLTFDLRLIVGLQPPLPAQLPVRGHGFRAAAPSSPAAPTRPRAGRAPGPGALQPAPRASPAPPRPLPSPLPPPGSRGGAAPAMPVRGSSLAGPATAGPCRPLVPSAGHTPGPPVPDAQLPGSQGLGESLNVSSKLAASRRRSARHCATTPVTAPPRGPRCQ